MTGTETVAKARDGTPKPVPAAGLNTLPDIVVVLKTCKVARKVVAGVFPVD